MQGDSEKSKIWLVPQGKNTTKPALLLWDGALFLDFSYILVEY
ncbi:hypothetical protein AsAng_0020910 [Aureispira anguillae]|uniref:Uncharacterized protein n=1 Tax=Aureispira anguillae TaxID=2864201 RepID=A0A915YE44_9BACT|nr:hypothetical protein AsAng_0020910 [Aureispira anguillae]